MRASALLALVLLGSAMAGCIGGGDESIETTGSPPGMEDLEDPVQALQDGQRQANIDLVSEWREGGAQEADAWDGYLFVDQGNQIRILDVSDPNKTEPVGQWSGAASPVDVKVSDDGRWAFVGDDTEGSIDQLGGTGPLTGGIYVLDVSDKTSPEQASFEPVGPNRGPHMVTYLQTSSGEELVLAAAGPDVVIHTFDGSTGELTEVARYTPGQMAQDRDPNRLGALYNPQGWLHDMIAMEEDDGSVLMYVAAWDAGLRVVDITDPGSPEEVGSWAGFGENEAGNLHTVATEWIGDRRITVGSVEVGFGVVGGTYYAQGSEKPVLYVWDTTDPSSIELVGEWVNPVMDHSGRDYAPDEAITSTHNIQLEQGRIYAAHYDLGVWVVDVSTPDLQTEPETLAFYNETDMNTWDVVLHDGVLYSSGAVGVLGLHFTPDVIGETGITSRA